MLMLYSEHIEKEKVKQDVKNELFEYLQKYLS